MSLLFCLYNCTSFSLYLQGKYTEPWRQVATFLLRPRVVGLQQGALTNAFNQHLRCRSEAL